MRYYIFLTTDSDQDRLLKGPYTEINGAESEAKTLRELEFKPNKTSNWDPDDIVLYVDRYGKTLETRPFFEDVEVVSENDPRLKIRPGRFGKYINSLPRDAVLAIRDGRIVDGIKSIRTHCGMGLKEAKELADSYRDRNQIPQFPSHYQYKNVINLKNLRLEEFEFLFIDSRYVIEEVGEGEEQEELRFAISFGPNFLSEHSRSFGMGPELQDGDSVLGLHVVGITGTSIRVLEMWLKTYAISNKLDSEDLESRVNAIFAAISDQEYISLVNTSSNDPIIRTGDVVRLTELYWEESKFQGRLLSLC